MKIIDTVPGEEKLLNIGDLNMHNGLWCGCGNDDRNGKTIQSFTPKVSIISDKESTQYSDHFPILVEISLDNSIYTNYEEPSKVNLKKINWEAIKNKLQETDVKSQVNCL